MSWLNNNRIKKEFFFFYLVHSEHLSSRIPDRISFINKIANKKSVFFRKFKILKISNSFEYPEIKLK